MKTRSRLLGLLVGFGSGLVFVLSANAATLTSDNFSIGYGFAPSGTWNTSETASSNDPLPTGDFSLVLTLAGPVASTQGPTFVNGVFGDTLPSTPSYASFTDGTGHNFTALATINYTGLIPPEATNIQMQLNITSISMYVGRIDAADYGDSAGFAEITSGHSATQGPIILTDYTNIAYTSNYSFLNWNPTDYASAGTSQARTFSIDADGTLLKRVAIDGFNIQGYATLTYDAVPEPTTIALLVVALGFGALKRKRATIVSA